MRPAYVCGVDKSYSKRGPRTVRIDDNSLLELQVIMHTPQDSWVQIFIALDLGVCVGPTAKD